MRVVMTAQMKLEWSVNGALAMESVENILDTEEYLGGLKYCDQVGMEM